MKVAGHASVQFHCINSFPVKEKAERMNLISLTLFEGTRPLEAEV